MPDKRQTLLASLTLHAGLVKSCNNAFTELFGFSSREIENTLLTDKLVLKGSSFSDLEALLSASIVSVNGALGSAKLFNNLHYQVPVKLHCLYEGDQYFTFYFCVSDNKSIDPITGLPNGWALRSRIDYLMDRYHLTLKNMALIIVDVDNFSTINYRFDYFVGDDYLVEVGKILQQTMKEKGFVVRYSNAKYAILIHEEACELSFDFFQHVKSICEDLCQVLVNPIAISLERIISKSFSIGVSHPGFEYNCYHSMQISAETEMQKAKKYSTNKYYIALPEVQDKLLLRKLIIDCLPQAMTSNIINVYYQPQYTIIGEKLIGLEALSRWHDNDLGHIPPDLFVSIAEDIGMHFEFDLWVFETVCLQINDWLDKNIVLPRVAINISFKTMEMSTFIERIKAVLDKTGCPASLLELEATETGSISNFNVLSDNMLALKALGIHIAVDDFGSGYSSLSLTRNFCASLDKLKLDRSLIEQACLSPLDKQFTRHVIELGKILNLKVLAEGVETKEQLLLLTELGCDYVQGYYFSKAMSCEETTQLLIK